MNTKDKLIIIDASILELENQLAVASEAAETAQNDANSHIGAMASRYDTFKEEAQYLSAAQRVRALELVKLLNLTKALRENILNREKICDIVKPGSIVTLKDSVGASRTYFILYSSLIGEFNYKDKKIIVIGDKTPIAKSLLGLTIGDDVDIILPNKKIIGEITNIE